MIELFVYINGFVIVTIIGIDMLMNSKRRR